MKLKQLDKKAQTGIGQLPGFFQVMMLVVIFAGLTFIVLEKFVDASYKASTGSAVNDSKIPTTLGTALTVNAYRDVSCSATEVLGWNATGGMKILTSGNYSIVSPCKIANLTNYFNAGYNVSYTYNWNADTTASNAVNKTGTDLYDYGIGFLGIVILVVMVYLIISIVSRRRSGAK